MPKSKRVEAYPYTYRDLIQHVGETGEARLNFPDKATAKKYQFDLYGYKSALAHENSPLHNIAVKVQMTIEVNLTSGYDLVLRNSMDDDINAQILNTIAEVKKDVPANLPGEASDSVKPYNPSVAPDLTNIPAPKGLQEGIRGKEVDIIIYDDLEEEEDTNEQSVYKQYMPSPAQDKEEG